MGATKKRAERDSELAYWFHVDPRGLTPAEKLGYLANLERMKAQQTIHLGNYDPADYRGVYSLWMAAWGDEDAARRAQGRAAEAYMDRACNAARRR